MDVVCRSPQAPVRHGASCGGWQRHTERNRLCLRHDVAHVGQHHIKRPPAISGPASAAPVADASAHDHVQPTQGRLLHGSEDAVGQRDGHLGHEGLLDGRNHYSAAGRAHAAEERHRLQPFLIDLCDRRGHFRPSRASCYAVNAVFEASKDLFTHKFLQADRHVLDDCAPRVRLHLDPCLPKVSAKQRSAHRRSGDYSVLWFKSDAAYSRNRCAMSVGRSCARIYRLSESSACLNSVRLGLAFVVISQNLESTKAHSRGPDTVHWTSPWTPKHPFSTSYFLNVRTWIYPKKGSPRTCSI